jgi:hypothetical protein
VPRCLSAQVVDLNEFLLCWNRKNYFLEAVSSRLSGEITTEQLRDGIFYLRDGEPENTLGADL